MKILHQTNEWTFAKLDPLNFVVFQSQKRMAYYHNPLAALNAYGRAVAGEVMSDPSNAVKVYSRAVSVASDALLDLMYED